MAHHQQSGLSAAVVLARRSAVCRRRRPCFESTAPPGAWTVSPTTTGSEKLKQCATDCPGEHRGAATPSRTAYNIPSGQHPAGPDPRPEFIHRRAGSVTPTAHD